MQSNVRLWLQFCYRGASGLGSLGFVHPHQLTQEGEEEGHSDKEGQHIGDGLADLNTQQPKGPGQGEDEWDEKHALTAAGQKGGPARFADGLEQHVARHDHGLQQHGKALVAEGRQGHGGDFGIIAEKADEGLGIEPADGENDREEAEAGCHGEQAGLLHPAVLSGTIVEACHRLKTLTGADGHRDDEHEDAGNDAHAGHGSVTIAAGGDVQQHSANTVQALTAKAGHTSHQDGAELRRAAGDCRDPELADRFAPQEHGQQDAEADGLAQGRGKARTGGAHAQPKDEQRVQRDVQQAAGDQADHGKAGLALIAQDIVHHQTGHHNGSGQQDVPRVGTGMGQDGLGAAQQHHKIGQGEQACHCDDAAEHQRREEAGGSKPGGGIGVLAAQAAADDAAGAVAQHEAQRLDNGHQAGNDAHCTGCAGGDLAHKKGVGQIVDAGDEHAQYRGSRQTQDQFRDGGLRHFAELLRAAVGICHEKTSLSL